MKIPKGMLVVVEGPDACGKTTFCEFLTRYLGGVFWHMSAPCNTPINEAIVAYDNNATENVEANLRLRRNVVLDRHWPSEVAYAPVFRKDGLREEIWDCAARVSLLRPVYVFCMDGDGVDSANLRHAEHLDPDHPYTPDKYAGVYKGYEELIHSMIEEGHTVCVRDFHPGERDNGEDLRLLELICEAWERANPPMPV